MYCTAVLDLVRTAVEPNTTMHLYSCAYATVAAAAACLQACWLLLHAARLRLLYGTVCSGGGAPGPWPGRKTRSTSSIYS
jgi:hypothetical protein